jgi:hypothetical protein
MEQPPATSHAPPTQAPSCPIFIGSGDGSLIERQVLIHSLRKHARRPLDIRVLNGTHNALEHAGGIAPLPLSLRLKYRSGDTEFGLYRYLIPELCRRAGRALYLDSDIVCLGDIGDLLEAPLAGADFLALPREDSRVDELRWSSAVMPIDCAATRFDLEAIFDEIEQGAFGQGDFMQLSPRFLARYPYRIGRIDPAWHCLDRQPPGAKLVHYTNMYKQPWRRSGHPYGAIWFEYFREACAAGLITKRGHVRPDLRKAFGWRERLAAAVRRAGQGRSPGATCKDPPRRAGRLRGS